MPSSESLIQVGDMTITPAHCGHRVRWNHELEIIGIALTPSLFTDAIDDSCKS